MENYKTTICLNYEKGIECRFGDKCNFAHGENEIRKTKCKFGIKCYNKNTYCKFEHNEESEVNEEIIVTIWYYLKMMIFQKLLKQII